MSVVSTSSYPCQKKIGVKFTISEVVKSSLKTFNLAYKFTTLITKATNELVLLSNKVLKNSVECKCEAEIKILYV